MKITGISIWHVDLTSHKTYYMSDGKTCDTVESVVVRLDTDAGIAGWGEHCVIPHYLPSFSRGIAPAITEMAPEILGHNPMGAPAFMHRLDKWLIGHDAAKSAVDMAFGTSMPRWRGNRFTTYSAESLPMLFPPITRSPASSPRKWSRLRKRLTPRGFVSSNANWVLTSSGKKTLLGSGRFAKPWATDHWSTVTGTAAQTSSTPFVSGGQLPISTSC